MKSMLITGIVMIVLGAVSLGYQYTYTSRETVLQIGPITATADTKKTIEVPEILGWLLIGAGACVLAFGVLSKKN